jgi:hypothetical protein
MRLSEVQEETKTTTSNLDKIRELVNHLEQQEFPGENYSGTLTDIKKVIEEEQKVIRNLKRADSKIKHYETMCSAIMALVTASH